MNSNVSTVLRLILGLILVVFGSNKFYNFLPMPPMEGPSMEFMGAIITSGYLFKFIAFTEVFSGALLIFNKWVGLAQILSAIIIVNILAFHLALDITGIGVGALMAIISILLFYGNWSKFKTLF